MESNHQFINFHIEQKGTRHCWVGEYGGKRYGGCVKAPAHLDFSDRLVMQANDTYQAIIEGKEIPKA